MQSVLHMCVTYSLEIRPMFLALVPSFTVHKWQLITLTSSYKLIKSVGQYVPSWRRALLQIGGRVFTSSLRFETEAQCTTNELKTSKTLRLGFKTLQNQ
jgi:hypothetical protein